MPIESNCQGCGRLLRVGDEHAGKLARCPHCQTIYTVPGGSAAATRPPSPFAETTPYPPAASAPFPASASASQSADRWTLTTPDGLTFGPVTKGELDGWLNQGRITPQSQLQQAGTSQWLWAGQVYPQLGLPPTGSPAGGGFPSPSSPSGNPFADRPQAPGPNPYAPPASGGAYNWPTPGYRFQEQHRGGSILATGIVSLFCCWVIALVTIVMAVIDLQKMSAGTMDPSGRGLTIAGLVCAIVRIGLDVGFIVITIANR